MADQESTSWMFKLLVLLAGVSGLILAKLLVEVVFGIEEPLYVSSTLGIIIGMGSNLYFSRTKMLKDADPNSPAARARHTAWLISNSKRN